jgi:hypothetical protein
MRRGSSMLALTRDGRVLDGSSEKFDLSERELDQLCDKLFPKDNVVRNAYMTRKRAKSYSGHHIDLANVSQIAAPAEEQVVVDLVKLEALGGIRLVTLYLTGMNYGLAADELGMAEPALRKWFSRWKDESPQTIRALAAILSGA